MGKEAFYCNKPCNFICDLGAEAVIEILSKVDLYYEETEPIYQKVIVDKKYITKKPIQSEDILKQYAKAEVEINKKKLEANKEIYNEKIKLLKEISDLKEKISKFDGLEKMYNYIDGKIKYIVYKNCYNKLIEELNNAKTSDSNNAELSAVSFRSKRAIGCHGNIKMFISQYSDDSGNQRYEIEGFENFEDAKEYALELINHKNFNINKYYINEFKKWGIECPKLKKYEEENLKQNERKRQKRIEELQKELQKLQMGTSNKETENFI